MTTTKVLLALFLLNSALFIESSLATRWSSRCRIGRPCTRKPDYTTTTRPSNRGSSSSGPDWGYDSDNGPAVWPRLFPTCGGSSQSPIDIRTNNVEKESNIKDILRFKNYRIHLYSTTITNNGHSAQVELNSSPVSLHVSYKDELYTLQQLHFHWGATNGRGSEHTIDGEEYPMEMHLVHYKAAYGTFENASKRPDGLLVLGILFEVSSRRRNEHFEPIIDALDEIRNNGTQTTIREGLVVGHLLPEGTECFFSYRGSLTTPTCDEVVQWIVFENTNFIGKAQLAEFRKLLVGNKPLVDNFRPPQPLNNRVVKSTC